MSNPSVPSPSPASSGLPQGFGSSPRFAVGLLLAINLFNYIDRYVLAAVQTKIEAEFFPNGDPNAAAKMGLLATAFLVSYMVVSPLFGWLADRGRRWLIVAVGVLLWSLASGGSGLATVWIAMLVMRIFVGIGEAAYGPTAPTLLSDLFPVERRGAILAWFYVAIPVGSALGYLLGGTVIKYTSWHYAFFLTLPPGILLGVLCLFMKEPKRGGADGVNGVRHASLADYLSLAKIPSYVLCVLGMTAFTFAVGGMSFWMPTYLHRFRTPEALQTDAHLASVNTLFGGITVVAGLAATLLGGWLADRLRARFSGSYFLVSGVGMLLGFPFFIASLYVPLPWAYALIFAAIFLLFLSTGPTNAIIANVTHPSVRATAFAACIFIIHALGDAISPLIIGAITDATKSATNPKGDMTLGFLLVGAMIVLSGVLWIWGAKHLKRDTEEAPGRVGT